jgi:uracil-DNA glycosylase family 4
MTSLDFRKLFGNDTSKCAGCKILGQPRIKHAVMDHEGKDPVKVLFISDSLKYLEGDFYPFRTNEYLLLKKSLRDCGFVGTTGFTASVKCPNIKAEEMSAEDMKICRQHLYESIRQYRPLLVFTCGSLANRMLIGKSQSEAKSRGKLVDFSVNDLHFKAVNIFHPYQAIAEPKNINLFLTDIRNSLEACFGDYYGKSDPSINSTAKKSNFTFKSIFTSKELQNLEFDYESATTPVSFDIETTGLNFLTDKILTIAMTGIKDGAFHTISMPIDHSSVADPDFRANCMAFVKNCLRNPHNRKILQECKFDMKFLMREGITDFCNIWDTKLMQHLHDEDSPKSLRDLAYYYCPEELNNANS